MRYGREMGRAFACVIVVAITACVGDDSTTKDSGGTDATSNDASPTDGTTPNDATKTDAGDAATSFAIYAHTSTTLFQIDSTSLTPTTIGTFDCIGGTNQDSAMTDIAVDKAQTLWGISAHNVYQLTLQGTTVHCATTIALQTTTTFYGLSLAPAGVLDPNNEVLVAANTAGELWAVDAQGNVTQHGTLGLVPVNDGHGHTYANNGKPWELSGDIVFSANGGNAEGFATVRDCPTPPSATNCDTADTLVAIDMTKLAQVGTQSVIATVRGQIVKSATCTDSAASYGGLYGIVASQGSVIGFSHTGSIVRISEVDGTGCLAQVTASDAWAGAGVSTLALP
jgi:hypothetical protein